MKRSVAAMLMLMLVTGANRGVTINVCALLTRPQSTINHSKGNPQ